MVDHKGLPVAGYQPQSDEKVALVNEFKQDEERLLRKLDEAVKATNSETRTESHGHYGDHDYEVQVPTYDPRWVNIARTHFQEGFMALNRAVFQPQRISLPEDEN